MADEHLMFYAHANNESRLKAWRQRNGSVSLTTRYYAKSIMQNPIKVPSKSGQTVYPCLIYTNNLDVPRSAFVVYRTYNEYTTLWNYFRNLKVHGKHRNLRRIWRSVCCCQPVEAAMEDIQENLSWYIPQNIPAKLTYIMDDEERCDERRLRQIGDFMRLQSKCFEFYFDEITRLFLLTDKPFKRGIFKWLKPKVKSIPSEIQEYEQMYIEEPLSVIQLISVLDLGSSVEVVEEAASAQDEPAVTSVDSRLSLCNVLSIPPPMVNTHAGYDRDGNMIIGGLRVGSLTSSRATPGSYVDQFMAHTQSPAQTRRQVRSAPPQSKVCAACIARDVRSSKEEGNSVTGTSERRESSTTTSSITVAAQINATASTTTKSTKQASSRHVAETSKSSDNDCEGKDLDNISVLTVLSEIPDDELDGTV